MKKYFLSIVLVLMTLNELYCQSIKFHIDSLVISSVPWILSPGRFGRSSDEIRGQRTIVVKDSISIHEFMLCAEKGLSTIEGTDFYIDPRVVIDIYYENTFISICVDVDQMFRYSNTKVVSVNRPLFKWLMNYVPM